MSTPEPVATLEDAMGVDQLELEVRQLAGVTFVGVGRRDGSLLVEVAAADGAELAALRAEVHRLAAALVDGPVIVEVLGRTDENRPEARVRLQVTLPLPGTTAAELHLAYRQRRTAVQADESDGLAVAGAVLAGLAALGLPAPWTATVVHALPEEIGAGALVVLEHHRSGETRRGVARGRSQADAVARAVLNALNRFLEGARPGGAGAACA